MNNTLKTEFIDYKLENGIVIASYREGLNIDLEIAKTIVEMRLAFTKDKAYPVLINSQGVVSMDKAARDFFSSAEGIRGLKAAGILVHFPFSSFLGNFFLWVNRTRLPVKIFSSYQAAVDWLMQFVS
jgi:hypothetical protein